LENEKKELEETYTSAASRVLSQEKMITTLDYKIVSLRETIKELAEEKVAS